MYFSDKYPTGVNPIVFGTYRTLREKGEEVFVYAHDVKPYIDEDYPYTKFFPKSTFIWDVEQTKENKKIYLRNMVYNSEAEKNLGEMLDEIKPDLVHIHTAWNMSFSILKPIKKRKIPVIFTVHDIQIFCPTIFSIGLNYCSDCRGYNTLPCLFKKCKGTYLKSAFYSIKSFTERVLGSQRDIDLYIAVSEATKQYMTKSGIKESKIRVLPNFANNEMVKSAENYEPKYGDFFFYAGGAGKIKGIETLLEAIKQLPKDICFHIAGGGDYERITEFIKNNNLQNVRISGPLTREQMEEEYKNCLCVLMPSECFETMGMINVEGAIFSKPSISSNIGGLSDVVENEKTGLLFEPANSEQLKECVLRYWKNKDLAVEHGKQAREKVLKVYREDLYFEKLLEIYKEVINTKRGKK